MTFRKHAATSQPCARSLVGAARARMLALRVRPSGDLHQETQGLSSDTSTRTLSRDAPVLAAHHAATQSQPRRVMFIINSLAGGGAERVMCTLLRASESEQRDCR